MFILLVIETRSGGGTRDVKWPRAPDPDALLDVWVQDVTAAGNTTDDDVTLSPAESTDENSRGAESVFTFSSNSCCSSEISSEVDEMSDREIEEMIPKQVVRQDDSQKAAGNGEELMYSAVNIGLNWCAA